MTLTIYIHDVDETPPTFEQASYNATLNETVVVGTVVLQVIATDPDPGVIGEVWCVPRQLVELERGKGSRVCHVIKTHDVIVVVGEVSEVHEYGEKPWLGIPTGKVRRSSDGGMYTRCSKMLALPFS